MPPAKIAGKITIKNFLTPSFLKFNFGTGNLFMLLRGAICINSCTKPASNTPQASTKISISYFGAINTAAIIKDKLKTTGVNAGIENF